MGKQHMLSGQMIPFIEYDLIYARDLANVTLGCNHLQQIMSRSLCSTKHQFQAIKSLKNPSFQQKY